MNDFIRSPQSYPDTFSTKDLETETQTESELELSHHCHIRVPASSGNLGPGFDTLGVALNLHNYFDINLDVAETNVEILSGMDARLHSKCQEMVTETAKLFFDRSALPQRPFHLKIQNNIPIARGLASSATVRLAVLCGLDHLLKAMTHTNDLVKWAAEMEGCTDNVASCYFGGFTASGIIKKQLRCYRFDISEQIDFVALSPTETVETKKARRIFSQNIPHEDAIFTLSHGILLACAFARGDYESMRNLFDDKIHQPQRQSGIPVLKPLFEVIASAQEAGAIGAFLSGSGSTIMAITLQDKEAVAKAMKDTFAKYSMSPEVRYLKADNRGLAIEA